MALAALFSSWRRLQKALEHGQHLRMPPVPRSDDFLDQASVFIDDKTLRYPHRTVEFLNLTFLVQQDGEGELVLLDEGIDDLGPKRIDAHRQDSNRSLQLIVKTLNRRHFFNAGLTPSGPNIEKDHFALEVRQ